MRELPHTPAIERMARAVAESDTGFVEPAREAALMRLIARLDGSSSPETSERDAVVFDAFESYLSLTRTVFADDAVIDALRSTHNGWRPGADRAALLSPRHLAEAVATGHVGSVEVRGVGGVPCCFEMFEWLASIVSRVKHHPDLRDGLSRMPGGRTPRGCSVCAPTSWPSR